MVGGVAAPFGLFFSGFLRRTGSLAHDSGPPSGGFRFPGGPTPGSYGSVQCRARRRGQSTDQKGAAAEASASTILRPEIAGLIRAAYDPAMPTVGRDASHALRLAARLANG